MEKIRSFIAIELPPEIRAELVSIEERLSTGRYSFVKWVEPSNIHLTLKFLGGILPEAVPQVIAAVREASRGISPFNLQVGVLGAFPNWQRTQVIWVGLGGELEWLTTLQKGIDALLSPLGFPQESRSFTPHLTLARLRDRVSLDERRRFGEWVCSTELKSALGFQVGAISLMKSQLTPSGAVYSCLGMVELKGTSSLR